MNIHWLLRRSVGRSSLAGALAVGALLTGACAAEPGASTATTDTALTAADGGADGVSASDTAGSAGADAGADAGSDATGSDAAASDGATSDASTTPQLYEVGVTQLTAQGPGGRELPVMVWYPALKGGKGASVGYLLDQVPSPTGAREGVDPAPGGPFPLVAFSHGNQGIRDQSFFLTEALAQHGYVVVSPNHVGNTFLDYDAALTPAMTLWRPQDIKAAIDRVLKPQAGDPPWLQGLADGKKVGVTGHSFGGYTALAVAGARFSPPTSLLPDCAGEKAKSPICQEMAALGPPPWNLRDERVLVSVPLAHCLTQGFEAKSLNALPIPLMLQASTGDTTCKLKPEAIATYQAVKGPRSLVVLQGGGHFSYASICELLPLLPPSTSAPFKAMCAPDAVPTIAQSHASVVRYALAAFDLYLKGKDEARQVFVPGQPADLPVQVMSQGVTVTAP